MQNTSKLSYSAKKFPMKQFNAKQRALRSKIRTQLAELVQKQNKLKLEGANMLELEEVSGEMEVLRKELQSVEDSGHTVFMSAKQMLAPKKELSQKQKKGATPTPPVSRHSQNSFKLMFTIEMYLN